MKIGLWIATGLMLVALLLGGCAIQSTEPLSPPEQPSAVDEQPTESVEESPVEYSPWPDLGDSERFGPYILKVNVAPFQTTYLLGEQVEIKLSLINISKSSVPRQ